MGHILVVDDDPDVLRTVRDILAAAGYQVETADNGEAALRAIAVHPPELVVLDVIMPEMDGLEVCRRIRANPYTARLPVLFLTAKGRAADVAHGLDSGGDDYVTKPFQVVELPARIRALLRRAPGSVLDPDAGVIALGRFELSKEEPRVIVDGQAVPLTGTEHRLLYFLASQAGRPVAADQILQFVWDYPPGVGNPNLVQVTVGRLRAKLKVSPDTPEFIHTLRGAGYLIAPEESP